MMSIENWSGLHDNAIRSLCFRPETGELAVEMDRPINERSASTTLLFCGVKRVSITGSLSNGLPGFCPGDGVLTVSVERLAPEDPYANLLRVEILLEAASRVVRPLTGVNTIEVIASSVELI